MPVTWKKDCIVSVNSQIKSTFIELIHKNQKKNLNSRF